ncbi:MAG: ArnT family glycosyltransferase, partial [Isosphaeraceae bacterium]
RCWPELVVGLLAGLIFLGSLGTLELWGKREQRASAEALDTVENGHWLVANIQGRPRLEKPPLPRWVAAALMTLTGRRDEWIVRLPAALSGLATVALIHALGREMGGRKLGLTAAIILCTTGLFVSELRQAGNDGPLGLCTTLALYAAWRRIGAGGHWAGGSECGWAMGSGQWAANAKCEMRHAKIQDRKSQIRILHLPFRIPHLPFRVPHSAFTFPLALGLGFLCKGPIILLLVGVTVVPYLVSRRVGVWAGLRQLVDPLGLALFLGLSLAWPVLVVDRDPQAFGVWITEMGQKTGVLPIGHQYREGLGLDLLVLALPWPVLATAGVVLPLLPNRGIRLPWRPGAVLFTWWWSIGNLAMLSFWAVAKPNYYVPCLPGLALLAAFSWLRLCRVAREPLVSRPRRLARGLLLLQCLILLACGIGAPIVSGSFLSAPPDGWLFLIMVLAVCGVALGIWIWLRGNDVLALLPFAAACAFGVVIGYGAVAPVDNPVRGHRRLARQLEERIPSTASTVRFFHEIDEGLWFYLRGHRLVPVPGSQPQYSNSYDRLDSLLSDGRVRNDPEDPSLRPKHLTQALLDWVRGEGRDEPYLLLRTSVYQRVAQHLEGLVTPIFQESGTTRNGLVLLRVRP